MRCGECGADNPDGSNFCNDCGARLITGKRGDVRDRDAVAEVTRKAASLVAKDAKLTRTEAVAKVLAEDRDLYEPYRSTTYAK